MRSFFILLFTVALNTPAFSDTRPSREIERWSPAELTFTSEREYKNPYVDVDFRAEFTNENGDVLLRPGFWDGGKTWKIRFTPPAGSKRWTYHTKSSAAGDAGLNDRTGDLNVAEYRGTNPLRRHGLLRMSPGHRNIVHADGTPFLLVADTVWALPFRGTPDAVADYARDRQGKGFNAALLMTVQPDQQTTGPRERTAIGGFAVGFEDLAKGHINELNVDYFQELDVLIGILLDHGIVPVFNPVFQGYGFRGGLTLGGVVDSAEYVRFQKYLIARFGGSPAIWLPNADAAGRTAAVEAAGKATEEWDAYKQPTGFHYSPFDDRQPDWTNDPNHGWHYNRIHQDADWLDFQWAQTGHDGDHKPEKVAAMYDNLPTKAAANGEPTYEEIGKPGNAAGWWQGEEAWGNLVAGGTMGVVYGAAGLWTWKPTDDEPGFARWTDAPASWRDGLRFEGSRYVGFINQALRHFDFTDMAKRPDLTDGKNLLAIPGRFYLSYLPMGGSITVRELPAGLPWRWFNPKNGRFSLEQRTTAGTQSFTAPGVEPWVLIVGEKRE